MTDWAGAEEVRAFLRRVSRRLALISAIDGAALGLALALDIVLIATAAEWRSFPINRGVALAVGGALGLVVGAIIAAARRPSGETVASDVERRAPACRNVLLTATELMTAPERVEPYIGQMVCADAAHRVAAIDVRSLLPVRRPLVVIIAIVITWLLALAGLSHRIPDANASRVESSAADVSPSIRGLDVIVTPPAYTARPPQAFHDPARIDAIVGSRIRLTVATNADSVGIETVARRWSLTPGPRQTFVGELTADADGFIAIEPTFRGRPGTRRLIGLGGIVDRAPRVKITAPAKDIFLTDVTRSIDVSVDADDDLGLSSVSLRYTKISGSGERFTFLEGEVPVTITRTTERAWTAKGTLHLAAFALEPGDMVVYRGVAADKRPGATPTESDAFIVEITSPGMVASEGFAMDDQQEKYALSQQMVILKTERLIAKGATIPVDSVSSQAQNIAAEQRGVRAQFVFMMGGELAEDVIAAAGLTDLNEEAEAAGEADLAAGRLQNRGRVALVQAIRFMSRAGTSLNTVDLPKALTEERAALGYLQQAFSRTRYLLRALTKREQLDLSRRLTGELTLAATDSRSAAEPAVDARLTAIRRALAAVATLDAQPLTSSLSASATASMLAQTVLAIDPSGDLFHRVSFALTEAGAAMDRRDEPGSRHFLDLAATGLALAIRNGLVEAPSQPRTTGVSRLEGALSDAARRPRPER